MVMKSANSIYEWGDQRPYYSLASYYKRHYGERIQKVSVNAGFTCPNRDGKVARGGCTYCNNDSFTPAYCDEKNSVTHQLNQGIRFLKKRYRKVNRYLAYFQSYSNTYNSVEKLESLYSEALNHPDVAGIAISTRPDCLESEKIDLLTYLAKSKIVIVEIGIESCYDRTLDLVNRGHSFTLTKNTICGLAGKGIHLGGHLLFGLPGESKEMMLLEADTISELSLDSIKFHQLQIIRQTAICKQYLQNPALFSLFSYAEYVDFIIAFVERLRPDIAIERFVSEAPPAIKVAPNWGNIRSDRINQDIIQTMLNRNSWQGKQFKKRVAHETI